MGTQNGCLGTQISNLLAPWPWTSQPPELWRIAVVHRPSSLRCSVPKQTVTPGFSPSAARWNRPRNIWTSQCPGHISDQLRQNMWGWRVGLRNQHFLKLPRCSRPRPPTSHFRAFSGTSVPLLLFCLSDGTKAGFWSPRKVGLLLCRCRAWSQNFHWSRKQRPSLF